jgi:hypothetical protein
MTNIDIDIEEATHILQKTQKKIEIILKNFDNPKITINENYLKSLAITLNAFDTTCKLNKIQLFNNFLTNQTPTNNVNNNIIVVNDSYKTEEIEYEKFDIDFTEASSFSDKLLDGKITETIKTVIDKNIWNKIEIQIPFYNTSDGKIRQHTYNKFYNKFIYER